MRWHGVAATAMRGEVEAAVMPMGDEPIAGLAVYHGDTDSRGGRAAHNWIIGPGALYLFEFTPGGYEPTTGPDGDEPAWTLSGSRADWQQAPTLTARFSNEHRGDRRRTRVTYGLGDQALPGEDVPDLAEFAAEYWRRRSDA